MLATLAHYPFLYTPLLFATLCTTLGSTASTERDTIDNGDERIHYYGPWTFKHSDDDPQGLNWQGTAAYGDIPDASAVVYFSGSKITVYGAFDPPGTYDMKSSYSIDDGPATTYVPNPTVSKSQYRQKFFESDALSDGKHTLTITNLGRQFWFDFAQVVIDSPVDGADPVTEDPLPQPQPQSQTTAQPSSSTTTRTPPPTSSRSTSTSSRSSSHSSSSSSSSPSFSPTTTSTSTLHTTLSITSSSNSSTTSTVSTDGPSIIPGALATTPATFPDSKTSPTTPDVSGSATPTGGTALNINHHEGLGTAAVVGIVVGAVLLVLLLGALFWWYRRRASKETDVVPYDRDLTAPTDAAAFPFDREKLMLATTQSREALISSAPPAVDIGAPRYAQADALASPASGTQPSPTHAAPAYAQGTAVQRTDTTRSKQSGVRGGRSALAPSTVGASDMVSPASTLPPLPRPGPMRQSLDGGVRLAGGPPGREVLPPPVDRDSIFSTAPPSYQYYP